MSVSKPNLTSPVDLHLVTRNDGSEECWGGQRAKVALQKASLFLISQIWVPVLEQMELQDISPGTAEHADLKYEQSYHTTTTVSLLQSCALICRAATLHDTFKTHINHFTTTTIIIIIITIIIIIIVIVKSWSQFIIA